MQHFRSLQQLNLQKTWVTIGSFDGVHRGHQALIGNLVNSAHAIGRDAVVITFFPHPMKVLRDFPGPLYLTSPDRRAELLGELGVDFVVTLEFNRQMADQSAETFMSRLKESIGLERLLIGPDFALGKGREAGVDRLAALGGQMGYSVDVVKAVQADSETVSSSRIRTLIKEGDVAQAANLLGRWYETNGEVVPGDGRGRTIGIPTANLAIWEEQIMPASGVYATLVTRGSARMLSVTNIGQRPTFEAVPGAVRVETHVLDFDERLYGDELKLEFVARLRDEQRFPSVDALVNQIRTDIEAAREILSHAI